MIEKVLANGSPIFHVETKAGKLVSVAAVGQAAAVVGQPIAFVALGSPVMQIMGLPLAVSGDAPDTQQFTIDIAVGALPLVAFELHAEFSVVDADQPLEGELYVNGNFIDHLWPGGNTRANGIESLQAIDIPGQFLQEGANTIEVKLIKSGAGFVIMDIPAPTLSFVTAGNNPAVSPLFVQAADAFDKLSKEL